MNREYGILNDNDFGVDEDVMPIEPTIWRLI